MTAYEALIEINAADANEFRAAAGDSGVDLQDAGKLERLDGASLLAFVITIAPSVIDLVKRWLEQRKTITVRVGKVVVETDSPDELPRFLAALETRTSE